MMYENKGGTELDTEISDVEHLVSTVRLFGLFVPATSKNLKILLAYRMLHAKDFVLAYNVLAGLRPNSEIIGNFGILNFFFMQSCSAFKIKPTHKF